MLCQRFQNILLQVLQLVRVTMRLSGRRCDWWLNDAIHCLVMGLFFQITGATQLHAQLLIVAAVVVGSNVVVVVEDRSTVIVRDC